MKILHLILALVFLLMACSVDQTGTTVETSSSVLFPTAVAAIRPTSTSNPMPTTEVIVPSPTIKHSPIILPPQGLYDSCVPSYPDCLNHLDTLGAKGFGLILNYGQLYSNSASQIAYADRAKSVGMKVIWALQYETKKSKDWMITSYPELAAESHCLDNYCLIAYFVNLVKHHPATWGYYVADEISPEEYEDMKKWTDVIRENDPSHPRLFVTAGSNDPMEQFYGFHSYMRDLADVFGPDYYPYGYINNGNSLTTLTGETAKSAQYWADKLDGDSAMVLQAFSMTRYASTPLCFPWPRCAPFPNYEQMKAQRDQVLLNSTPAIILWWTYQDILKTDNPTQHLNELASAAFGPLPTFIQPTSEPPSICPFGWHCEDIGNPVYAGSQVLDNDIWKISGSGWSIWAEPDVKADQFRFVWQALDGDGSISVKFINQTAKNRFSKAGIMIRKSFDPVSPYYSALISFDSKLLIQYSIDYGREANNLRSVSVNLPLSLKITRSGDVFSSYISEDGINWKLVQNSTIELPRLKDSLMVGMAVTSGDNEKINVAQFEKLELENTVP